MSSQQRQSTALTRNGISTALSFEDLPFEMREQIFSQCSCEMREGIFSQCSCEMPEQISGQCSCLPTLIAALRPQQNVYTQALQIYYRTSVHILCGGNNWSFPHAVSTNAISNIQNLYLSLTSVSCTQPDTNERTITNQLSGKKPDGAVAKRTSVALGFHQNGSLLSPNSQLISSKSICAGISTNHFIPCNSCLLISQTTFTHYLAATL